jgi:NAD(P)-dependent dehydrogenase (short-subunit alcohol dehydrogenase family)
LSADRDFLVGLLQLEGRVALITGARIGIGRALALGFGKAGARIAVTSREPKGCDELAQTLEQRGTRASSLQADVRSAGDAEDCVRRTVEVLGGLDILVNNAGIAIRGPALTYPEESWDLVLDTNLKGAFLMAQAAARVMRERKAGRIINLSSTFARSVKAERAAYAASKAGLEQLTRVLAKEWAADGITVNGIALTTVLTETRQTRLASEEVRLQRIAEIPLGRLGLAEDAVPAALFLAGAAGDFVTGHTIYMDGGFTLR